MATIVLFNGALNVLILGIPAYIWTFLVVTLMLIFSNAYWYLIFWSPLKSLHGLWRATWGKTDAALVVDLDTNMKLVSEAQSKLIFDEEIAEAKRDEKDWTGITSGQMGVIGTDIILDLGKWTNINNDDRYAIQKAADDFNLLNPDDQIHSFQKFMRYCENGKIEVEIPIFVLVEWLRIESAFPRERSKAAYAGYIRQLAERLDKEERSKFDTYAIYMLVAAGIISVLFILSKFLIHKPA
jgi:hypothetical protein